jgi:NAD(P)-dependent dehydrogenase (short-subunit alcohol dehydrogenase family)
MNAVQNLLNGFAAAFTPMNLFWVAVGVVIGTLIGILPGLGPPATLAILLPVTISLPPATGLIMMAGIYHGAKFAGATTSILLNIPGNALRGDPGRFHVSAAKYGLVGLAKALAAACAADHVNVNAVSPSNMNPEPGPEAEKESQRRREAVADAVAFLVSGAGCDVTGQLIDIGAAR